MIYFSFIIVYSSEKLYDNKDIIEERHRHRYEINPDYINDLETAGLKFVGKVDPNKINFFIKYNDVRDLSCT